MAAVVSDPVEAARRLQFGALLRIGVYGLFGPEEFLELKRRDLFNVCVVRPQAQWFLLM